MNITLSESTSESHGGGSSREGTSAGLSEEDCVACKGPLLQGGVAVLSQAHLFHATAAKGGEHCGGRRSFPDVLALPADPVVVGTGVEGELRRLASDVHKARPANPDQCVRISYPRTIWPRLGRLRSAAQQGAVFLRGRCWDAAHMQQPSPVRVFWMLHAARMQFRQRNERSSFGVSVDAQELVDSLR